ncbi:MAG: tRNA (adenosine(37)-N6)-threonylcarbamoyltransferase complex dimerization subunit type 1 TsaB [Frankiales bacterium]|nr:tRNA (adenosine(37)-N6)-threonylcarbamoyltransferase complex dimerization subunit type 1 TsaB [Frankiales bacterium]
MLVLVLDTSSPAVSAGLMEVSAAGCELLRESVVIDGRRHGELLAVGAREVLAGQRPSAVVVGTGPGPFTGLRVGLVTAAAMADAFGVPAYGVCSLDGFVDDGVVVTDARRREVYWARYADGTRVQGPTVSAPADLPAGAVLVGARLVEGVGGPEHVSVLRLARVAAARVLAGAPSEALTPLYLRRPDAVELGAVKRVTA